MSDDLVKLKRRVLTRLSGITWYPFNLIYFSLFTSYVKPVFKLFQILVKPKANTTNAPIIKILYKSFQLQFISFYLTIFSVKDTLYFPSHFKLKTLLFNHVLKWVIQHSPICNLLMSPRYLKWWFGPLLRWIKDV